MEISWGRTRHRNLFSVSSQSVIDHEPNSKPADITAFVKSNCPQWRLRWSREGSLVFLVSLLPTVLRHVPGGGGTWSLVSPCMEHTQCPCPLDVRSVKSCTTTTDDVRNPLPQPVVICHLSARVPNQRRLNSHYPAESEMLYGCTSLMDVLNWTCGRRPLQHLRYQAGAGDGRVSRAAHVKIGSLWVSRLCSTSRSRRSAVIKYWISSMGSAYYVILVSACFIFVI